MQYISDDEIENKAIQLLHRYSINQKWTISFPIPVDLIVEIELGCTIDTFEEKMDILGAIDLYEKIIYINSNSKLVGENDNVYRFTIAHEIGHLELHSTSIIKQLHLIDEQENKLICRNDDNSRMEIQANRYAGALLMPRQLIYKEIESIDIRNSSMLYSVSKKCNVSLLALKIRLEHLGIIHPEKITDILITQSRAEQKCLF